MIIVSSLSADNIYVDCKHKLSFFVIAQSLLQYDSLTFNEMLGSITQVYMTTIQTRPKNTSDKNIYRF